MPRSRLALAAVAAAALLAGAFSGELLALPTRGAGLQTALPVVQPLPATYLVPVNILQPLIAQLNIGIGRDDLSPYALVWVRTVGAQSFLSPGWPGPGPSPAINLAAATSYEFVYRPLWDQPLIPTLPAAATQGAVDVHWGAVHTFEMAARHLQEDVYGTANSPVVTGMYAQPPARINQILMWLDAGVFGTGAINDAEFYKFELVY